MPDHSLSHRVVFFISSYRAGGGEKQVIDIANAVAARGHMVDLLVLKPVGPYESRVSQKIRVISLDRGRMAFSLFPLISYMRRERPGVLMALDEYTQVLALLARMLSGVRVRIVLRIGNMLSELSKRYQTKRLLTSFLVRWLYKRADAIIANSQGVARDVSKVCGVPQERIRVIFNPKDLDEIRRAAALPIQHPWLANGRTDRVIAWFGRLREQKNLPMLLRAFAQLQSIVPSRLVLVGQGREAERLEALAQDLGITERVYFAGYQDNPHAYVAKADVYVLSSLWEGLPNALIEALICCVPAIAADCDSGPREILAPESDPFLRIKEGVEWTRYGALVPVNGEQELTEALAALLTDDRKHAHYAAAARERSLAFDEQVIIPQYLDALGIS